MRVHVLPLLDTAQGPWRRAQHVVVVDPLQPDVIPRHGTQPPAAMARLHLHGLARRVHLGVDVHCSISGPDVERVIETRLCFAKILSAAQIPRVRHLSRRRNEAVVRGMPLTESLRLSVGVDGDVAVWLGREPLCERHGAVAEEPWEPILLRFQILLDGLNSGGAARESRIGILVDGDQEERSLGLDRVEAGEEASHGEIRGDQVRLMQSALIDRLLQQALLILFHQRVVDLRQGIVDLDLDLLSKCRETVTIVDGVLQPFYRADRFKSHLDVRYN